MEQELGSSDNPNIPIWELPNAELYSSAPGLERYVIWKYVPGSEGVNLYNRFDNFDPLSHHYYASVDEYEAARRKYTYGGDPDKLIDVHSYPVWEQAKAVKEIPEIIIFQNGLMDGEILEEARAA